MNQRFDYFPPRLGVDRRNTAVLTGGGSPSKLEHKDKRPRRLLSGGRISQFRIVYSPPDKSGGRKNIFLQITSFFSFTFCHFHRRFYDAML